MSCSYATAFSQVTGFLNEIRRRALRPEAEPAEDDKTATFAMSSRG
jgi:hypothetical protein